jgi:DNA-binding response OmpR family regulator
MSNSKHQAASAVNAVRPRLLIVEDDKPIAMALARSLAKAGYETRVVDSGEAALYVLANESYDQMLLDIGLPGIDGFEVLRKIRAAGSAISVLVVTARDAVDERVLGLSLGADDYVVKPFELTEIVARVHALARRGGSRAGYKLTNGPLTMDIEGHSVAIKGELVEVPPREWEILKLLLTRVQKIVSKDLIVATVMKAQGEKLSDNAIDVYVSRLRAKLQPSGVHIRTVRGHGFMLLDCVDAHRPGSAR